MEAKKLKLGKADGLIDGRFRFVITLPHQIKGRGELKGNTYTQVKAFEGRYYIYKVDTGYSEHYECFKAKVVRRIVDYEKFTKSADEGIELYPKGYDFGYSAWCVGSYAKAVEKLYEKFGE